MKALLNAAIENIWGRIEGLTELSTPDELKSKSFKIKEVKADVVEIATEAGTPINIQRAAFFETLRYLLENRHSDKTPCEIRSNQHSSSSGPLCLATRMVNGNARVVNYTVPILVAVGLIEISGKRPNTVWLV